MLKYTTVLLVIQEMQHLETIVAYKDCIVVAVRMRYWVNKALYKKKKQRKASSFLYYIESGFDIMSGNNNNILRLISIYMFISDVSISASVIQVKSKQ